MTCAGSYFGECCGPSEPPADGISIVSVSTAHYRIGLVQRYGVPYGFPAGSVEALNAELNLARVALANVPFTQNTHQAFLWDSDHGSTVGIPSVDAPINPGYAIAESLYVSREARFTFSLQKWRFGPVSATRPACLVISGIAGSGPCEQPGIAQTQSGPAFESDFEWRMIHGREIRALPPAMVLTANDYDRMIGPETYFPTTSRRWFFYTEDNLPSIAGAPSCCNFAP